MIYNVFDSNLQNVVVDSNCASPQNFQVNLAHDDTRIKRKLYNCIWFYCTLFLFHDSTFFVSTSITTYTLFSTLLNYCFFPSISQYKADTDSFQGDLPKACKTCSVLRCPLRSHSLVCTKNHLFIVGIVPTLNKEIEFIFLSDRSDRTCVYSQISLLQDTFQI